MKQIIASLAAVTCMIAAASVFTASTASACNVVGRTKSGERLCATTYVYKKSKRWDDPSQWSKPAEKCRSTCLRDAMKLATSAQQGAYFNMCKRNKGCP
ncbi:MAG: hypothetical protein AB7E80_00395 [Hyphomicrobiaceae bacterium]